MQRCEPQSQGDTGGSAGLLGSLAALRDSLVERGSNLVVRCGALPEVLGQLVLESGAAEILAEEEVEYRSASLSVSITTSRGMLQHLMCNVTVVISAEVHDAPSSADGTEELVSSGTAKFGRAGSVHGLQHLLFQNESDIVTKVV